MKRLFNREPKKYMFNFEDKHRGGGSSSRSENPITASDIVENIICYTKRCSKENKKLYFDVFETGSDSIGIQVETEGALLDNNHSDRLRNLEYAMRNHIESAEDEYYSLSVDNKIIGYYSSCSLASLRRKQTISYINNKYGDEFEANEYNVTITKIDNVDDFSFKTIDKIFKSKRGVI